MKDKYGILNKKAFTLVELLAVIVILSVLLLLVIPKITSSVNKQTTDVDDVIFELIKKASVLYIEENSFNYPLKEGSIYCVSLKELTDKEYIEAPIKNFKTSEDITNKKSIKIKYDTEYSYSLVDNDKCTQTIPICNAVSDEVTANKPPYDGYNAGDAYDCEVKEGTWYRFYILSIEGDNVNLIAQQNITPTGEFTSEAQDRDEWYEAMTDNGHGPQTAYTYLKEATKHWVNIPTIKNFTYYDEGMKSDSTIGYQSIITKFDSTTGDYITIITPYSKEYGNAEIYENMRARLPYVSEIEENTTCSTQLYSCPLWMVNYLVGDSHYSQQEGKVNSESENFGYWTLSSMPGSSIFARNISNDGIINSQPCLDDSGIRPVITLPKTSLNNIVE